MDDTSTQNSSNKQVAKTSRRFLSKLIIVAIYLAIWTASLVCFWVASLIGDDLFAMGYAVLVFYIVLPITTLVLSFLIGKNADWGNSKWLMLLFFSVMFMLLPYLTYSLANTLAFGNLHWPEPYLLFIGIMPALIGMTIGSLIKKLKSKQGN